MQSMPEQSSAVSRMSAGDKPSSLCVSFASATAATAATTRNPKPLLAMTVKYKLVWNGRNQAQDGSWMRRYTRDRFARHPAKRS